MIEIIGKLICTDCAIDYQLLECVNRNSWEESGDQIILCVNCYEDRIEEANEEEEENE